MDSEFKSNFSRIVAAYLAIVYFAARIIRSVVTSEPLDVIIQEMPNPDYLLKICLDIYLVREARDVSGVAIKVSLQDYPH